MFITRYFEVLVTVLLVYVLPPAVHYFDMRSFQICGGRIH